MANLLTIKNTRSSLLVSDIKVNNVVQTRRIGANELFDIMDDDLGPTMEEQLGNGLLIITNSITGSAPVAVSQPVTPDQRAALDAAVGISGANPVATLTDIVAAAVGIKGGVADFSFLPDATALALNVLYITQSDNGGDLSGIYQVYDNGGANAWQILVAVNWSQLAVQVPFDNTVAGLSTLPTNVQSAIEGVLIDAMALAVATEASATANATSAAIASATSAVTTILASVVDADSGADKIGLTEISGFPGLNLLQSFLESLVSAVNNKTDVGHAHADLYATLGNLNALTTIVTNLAAVDVANDSNVAGAKVKDALDALLAGLTPGTNAMDNESTLNGGVGTLTDALNAVAVGLAPQPKTEILQLLNADITNGYVTLQFAPTVPGEVDMSISGGSDQHNKAALTAGSGAAEAHFQMDTVSSKRLYFKNVAAVIGTNDEHVGLNPTTPFIALQILIIRYHHV